MKIRKLILIWIFIFIPLFGASLPQITNISIKEDNVVLTLSKPLLSTPKKASLELPDKTKERFYFDFGAQLSIPPQASKTPFLFSVKIAQFDKQTARLVIIADKKAKLGVTEEGNHVIVKLVGTRVQENTIDRIVKKAETLRPVESVMDDDTVVSDEQKEPIKADRAAAYLSEKKKTIVLDAGHGGKDSGALGASGTQEKDIVLRVVLILKDMLQKKGYKVFLTRDNDIFIELQERTRFANQKNADLFVSVHANAVDLRYSDASKFHGIETYFLSPARSERAKKAAEKENGLGLMDTFSKETFLNFLNREKIVASNKLAIDIQRGMLSYAKSKYKDTTDGGVKEAPFWVLVGAQMPAVLVEIGYLTHEGDLEKLREDYYKALIAKGIMEGIENYFQNN
jgi:N-acetylmuramoyl-L-alanine amidase